MKRLGLLATVVALFAVFGIASADSVSINFEAPVARNGDWRSLDFRVPGGGGGTRRNSRRRSITIRRHIPRSWAVDPVRALYGHCVAGFVRHWTGRWSPDTTAR